MRFETAYRPYRLLLVVSLLLLIPLISMQFSQDVVWAPFDFAVAFVLLFGAGLTYQLVSRRRADTRYRFAVGAGVGAALLLVWVNLAVGLIGNEEDPRNLMYAGVLAVATVGAALSRLKPRGLAYAMFATAIWIVLVGAIGLFNETETREIVKTLGVTGFFAALFLGSGLLFRSAAPR